MTSEIAAPDEFEIVTYLLSTVPYFPCADLLGQQMGLSTIFVWSRQEHMADVVLIVGQRASDETSVLASRLKMKGHSKLTSDSPLHAEQEENRSVLNHLPLNISVSHTQAQTSGP